MRRGLTGLLLALLATPALSHDLWIDHSGGTYVLSNGHKHSSHGGDQIIPYSADFVRQAQCFDQQGKVKTESQGGSPFRLVADCAALTVTASSGYWSKTTTGTKNLPKDEAKQVVKSWLSHESVKRIDTWSPALAKPLTQELEIVPLDDPLRLSASDKLHLRVTLAGRPVSGATVTYDGEPRGATDADGNINVRLRHGGYQMIATSVTRPLASPKADEEVRAASLVFELPN
jgi:nickel transport protein